MNNYFDQEFSYIERELTRLKTSAQRSASLVETKSHSYTVTLPLELDSSSSPEAAVQTAYLEIITDKPNALIMPTLNQYYTDITTAWEILPTVSARYFEMREVVLPNGNVGLKINAFGTNVGANNDAQKLAGGESIRMVCNLVVRATCDFTVRLYDE